MAIHRGAYSGTIRNSSTSLNNIILSNLYSFLAEVLFCDSTRIQYINYFVIPHCDSIYQNILPILAMILKSNARTISYNCTFNWGTDYYLIT